TRKPIRNVYLRLTHPDARLRMSAPARMPLEDIERFVRAHRTWIDRRRERIANIPRVAPLTYVTGEAVPLFGKPHQLVVESGSKRASVQIGPDGSLILRVPPRTDRARREATIKHFYRAQLQSRIPELISAWEPRMGVSVADWRIRNMRTRWGTCNIRARRIWLGLELATRPEQCLEYVVVHEMNHLLERGHTRRFYELMDSWMPDWRERREMLSSGFPTIDPDD
ncbi:MAG: M48 family metallopeptidase, partial [Chloroflexota bacterium]|nr:M48 family metallopeptidase [Chloroflexota bacterium]